MPGHKKRERRLRFEAARERRRRELLGEYLKRLPGAFAEMSRLLQEWAQEMAPAFKRLEGTLEEIEERMRSAHERV